MAITYNLDLAPCSADDGVVTGGLQASNSQLTGHEAEHYSVFARDEKMKIIGGALTWVGRDSAFVSAIWVDKPYRRQRVGRRLLDKAEMEAKKRGCIWIKLDTYEFQTSEFYLDCGYTVYGEVKDYTCGQSKIFLRKRLRDFK